MKTRLIGFVYRKLIKPILFKKDPEEVHDSFMHLGALLSKYRIFRVLTGWTFSYKHSMLNQVVDNIKIPNPVGLSAGFDKEAEIYKILHKVGFGFIQIGSVTLKPYEGNKGKRVVRLKKTGGLIVNFGLKNKGIDIIGKLLPKQGQNPVPISVSVAKTNHSSTDSMEKGAKDYIDCIKHLEKSNLGDFYTINISCPNTACGEPFTNKNSLEYLLKQLKPLNIKKPIYLKMPIDKKWKDFKELLLLAVKYKVKGVVIGNLLKDRTDPSIMDELDPKQKGGISGLPTIKTCNRLIFKTYQDFGKELTIIGAGGVFDAKEAYEKIKLGATSVQLITGMIFKGPQVIGEINRGLVKLLKADGYSNISEAIGEYHKKSIELKTLRKKRA